MQPKLKFKLNKALDKKMALESLDTKQGGIDFSQGVINVHPELKSVLRMKGKPAKKKIDQHFDGFYQEHKIYLQKRVKEFDIEWKSVELNFFQVVKRLFKGYSFPQGKYIGYLSIIDCNPRFLKDKTFQVFYAHPLGVRYVAAHELLHFIFYDYAIDKFPAIFKTMNTEEGLFWNLAEIFNVVILHTPEFVKIHGQKRRVFYPEHKKYIQYLVKIWHKEKDIDKWIQDSLAYIQKRK